MSVSHPFVHNAIVTGVTDLFSLIFPSLSFGAHKNSCSTVYTLCLLSWPCCFSFYFLGGIWQPYWFESLHFLTIAPCYDKIMCNNVCVRFIFDVTTKYTVNSIWLITDPVCNTRVSLLLRLQSALQTYNFKHWFVRQNNSHETLQQIGHSPGLDHKTPLELVINAGRCFPWSFQRYFLGFSDPDCRWYKGQNPN